MRYEFAMKKNMITFAQNGFFIVTIIEQENEKAMRNNVFAP